MRVGPTMADLLDSLRCEPMTIEELMIDTGRGLMSVRKGVWQLKRHGLIVEVAREHRGGDGAPVKRWGAL